MDAIDEIKKRLREIELLLEEVAGGSTNIRAEESKTSPLEISVESIYALYPRKIGKKRGLQKLKKADMVLVKRAVLNYRNYCIQQEMEPQFIKHFSTWANEWEDWIEPPMVISPAQEKRRIEREKRELKRRQESKQPTPQLTQEEKEANKQRLANLMADLADNMKP